VFSANTILTSELTEFASESDLPVQDACVARETTKPNRDGLIWDRLTEPMSDEHADRLLDIHCDVREAGEIAANANVETLVLTHLLPYRDTDVMVEQAKSTFDGEVIVAQDGLQFSL
jgi:ribonuclease BN (tRNA processing enzyme)